MSPLSSPAARVTLVMSCLFGTTGVVMVFLPRWLEVERGLMGAEIGLVLSLAQFARVLTGPLIAFWADGAGDRRTPLRVVAAASLITFAAFFFVARDFWSLLVI
ncbi:MAG TPA: MFS transporter, partial [Terricaulis sp.]|nr:MFS transporter [Terricaulis sp.]